MAFFTISIHALRGEGDGGFTNGVSIAGISIHALRGEGDAAALSEPRDLHDFYPRPPWGGRPWKYRSFPAWRHFYPRPPWGGRPQKRFCAAACKNFYPRPPWGGRRGTAVFENIKIEFLSTPSVGRATKDALYAGNDSMISIHALRGEGDYVQPLQARPRPYFYPRPPWGGRLLPGWTMSQVIRISIHALRGEGDNIAASQSMAACNFYPRPPWGGRLKCRRKELSMSAISIHALRGEGDPHEGKRSAVPPSDFYPRPPWGGRRKSL